MEPPNCTFEGISVDRRRMAIERDGAPVDLEPKAVDVLLFLIDHRDRLVTKDELLDAVWKDTFVTPNVLTRAVAQIRKALGDDADQPRIIETVAKRGYRFIATVQVSGPATTPETTKSTGPIEPRLEAVERGRPDRKSAVALIAIITIAAAAIVVFAVVLSNKRATPTPAATSISFASRRLTTRAGFNGQPAVSPDGRSVAYVSDRTGSLEIYVTGLVATGTETILTSNGAQNMQPDWSPDGHWLAFHSRKLGGIWVVASNGGQPRQVAVSGADPSWAPDSERIVFTSNSGGFIEQATLWTVYRDGSKLEPLTKIGQAPGGATSPTWSHNGKLIAFVNAFGGGTARPGISILSMADGTIRQIHSGSMQTQPRFGPDDNELYWIGVGESITVELRRLAIDPATGAATGAVEPVLPIEGIGEGLSISRSGVAAYAAAKDDDNLWVVDTDTGGTPTDPVRVTNDSVRNNRPSYSRDGRVAYQQLVPGFGPSIWVANADGTGASALLPGIRAYEPLWSSDGSRLFALQAERAVWVDLGTRHITEIPIALKKLNPQFARLSPDDREIAYHRIEADGQMAVWIAPLDGGPERRIATDREGVGFPVWSRDGKTLAVEMRRGDHTFIGIVPSDGSQSIKEIVTAPGNSWPHSWSADGRRIAYAGERDGVWNIWEVKVATKVSRPLTHFTLPIGYVRYPNWSADGRRLIFERAIRSSSVWTTTIK